VKLSDESICKRIETFGDQRLHIDPFSLAQVQPASYDVLLGPGFLTPVTLREWPSAIDPRDLPEDLWDAVPGTELTLAPGAFALGATLECVEIPTDLSATLSGKSTLGRIGLAVHVTAGYIDPGFQGNITLELWNHSPNPLRLTAGMRIGQLSFDQLDRPAVEAYGSSVLGGSHYQRQVGPTPPRSLA